MQISRNDLWSCRVDGLVGLAKFLNIETEIPKNNNIFWRWKLIQKIIDQINH